MSNSRGWVIALTGAVLLAGGGAGVAQDAPSSRKEAARLVGVVQSDASLHDKQEACRQFAGIGDAVSAAPLTALLTDEKLSHMVRYALEPIPGPAIDEGFRNAMGKCKGLCLVGVINSIGARRDAKAVDALASLLQDKDLAVASAAAMALGRIAAPGSAVALAKARASVADGALRLAVLDGSLELAGQLVRDGQADKAATIYQELQAASFPRHIQLGALAGLLSARPEQAPTLIVQAIQASDPLLRATAISRVAGLKGADVSRRFAAELPKLDADNQVLMIAALANRADPAIRPALVAAMANQAAPVRLAAIQALAKVGGADCVDVLCGIVAEGKTAIEKQAAADSLRLLGGEGVDAAMIQGMKAAPLAARPVLISVLADRQAAGAVGELLAQARQADPAVRSASLKALGQLASPDDLPKLLALLVETGSPAAGRAVVLVSRRISDPAAQAGPALAAYQAAKPADRAALIHVLGGIGGDKAFQAVRTALGDADPAVQDAAIRALAAWPDPQALDALLKIGAESSTGVHRVLALRGAVRLLNTGVRSGEQTLGIYRDLMKQAARPEDKRLVLAGLGGMSDPAAMKIVEPQLANPDVQGEAELAMMGIAARVAGLDREASSAAARKLIAQSKNDRIHERAQSLLDLQKKLGDFVTAWQFAGPYVEEGKSAVELFDVAFAPEKADAAKVAWTLLTPSGPDGKPWMFDLGPGETRVGYVRTWIHSDKVRPVRLEFGADDAHKLWLNGKLVHAANDLGAATPGKYKAPVQLAKGWNLMMMKVTQNNGPWQFCFRIAGPDGGKMEGLRIWALPPAE